MTVTKAIFGGETSTQEIYRLSDLAKDAQCDFVIALGGGKTCDTAKAIADIIKTQVAILPTTASTDAPCSALSVLYTPEGTFDKYSFYDKNPALVLVDTSIIVKAPARFLSAGIGDALATNVEARQCRNSPNMVGGLPTGTCSILFCSMAALSWKLNLMPQNSRLGGDMPEMRRYFIQIRQARIRGEQGASYHSSFRGCSGSQHPPLRSRIRVRRSSGCSCCMSFLPYSD